MKHCNYKVIVVKLEHLDRQNCALTTSTTITHRKFMSILQVKTYKTKKKNKPENFLLMAIADMHIEFNYASLLPVF